MIGVENKRYSIIVHNIVTSAGTVTMLSRKVRWPLSRMARRPHWRTMSVSLHPPTVDEEARDFEQRVRELEAWFNTPRFAAIKRPYSASSVVSKQGSHRPVPLPSALVSEKLFNLLQDAAKDGRPLHTLGVIDPVQMTQQAERQEVVYVSGWACSSTLTTGNNEVGPDLA